MVMMETATPNAPREWPTLLGDNARTGGQGQIKLHFPEKAAWQYRAGSAVRSAPVLREGILYVASVSGVLHAIDVGTGISKWKFESAGQVYATPSLFGNMVLFGCDDGKIYALDRHSGKKLWEAARALREDTVATLCIRRFDIHDLRRNPDQVVRLTPRRSRTTEKSCRRQPRNYPGSIALSLTL
jgi:glucose dehydrogenase